MRKGSIIPEVAFVRKTVSYIAEFALLDVLLQRIQRLLFGDLDVAT